MNAKVIGSQSKARAAYQEIMKIKEDWEMNIATGISRINNGLSGSLPTKTMAKFVAGMAVGSILLAAAAAGTVQASPHVEPTLTIHGAASGGPLAAPQPDFSINLNPYLAQDPFISVHQESVSGGPLAAPQPDFLINLNPYIPQDPFMSTQRESVSGGPLAAPQPDFSINLNPYLPQDPFISAHQESVSGGLLAAPLKNIGNPSIFIDPDMTIGVDEQQLESSRDSFYGTRNHDSMPGGLLAAPLKNTGNPSIFLDPDMTIGVDEPLLESSRDSFYGTPATS